MAEVDKLQAVHALKASLLTRAEVQDSCKLDTLQKISEEPDQAWLQLPNLPVR